MNTLKDIDIRRLLPHPENSNRMDAITLNKLRKHIERSGRYEPLVVRPHPTEAGQFQVINGHHRLQVLKALGQTSAKCVVWDVDDQQTRLYLATLNRLTGNDIPERRAMLISSLFDSLELGDLAELLPENQDQLAELKRFSKSELDDFAPGPELQSKGQKTVILEFFLDHDRAQDVNLALDLVAHRLENTSSRSDALVHIARCYLAANAQRPIDSPTIIGAVDADS